MPINHQRKMPKLQLDESTHSYSLGDRKLISVTQALSILDDRWKVDPFYLERGRLIHLCTQYYDHDELDESTVDERIEAYFGAYVKFKQDTGFIPTFIEEFLYHPCFFYAGKIDRIGDLNGKPVLIDLKSGAKAKVDELQDAAYWSLALANGLSVTKLFDLYLKDNGTYKLEPVKNPKLLLPIFLGLLRAVQWKENL